MSRSTRNSGKAWTPAEVRELAALAAQNTPTRVAGLKLGRRPAAIAAKPSEEGISPAPPNPSPYNRRSR